MTARDTRPPAPAIPRAIITLNDRRLCLLEKKYRRGACGRPGGLSTAEQAELNACAAAMDEFMGRSGRWAGRREVLDEFAAYVAEMRAKVEAKRGQSRGADR